MSTLTLVATVQQPDPYDERDGPWFSSGDLRALAALSAGTKLYTTAPMAGEAHQVEVDRDIKAANLQLLVEKVLAIDKQPDRSAYELAIMAAIALARSLK